MTSSQDIMSPDKMKFSISCFDVPEGLLQKDVARNYFQRFGKLVRVRLRSKQKSCAVEYSDEESAVRALTESGDFDGYSFRVAWTKQRMSGEKKNSKKVLEYPMDTEIQSELEAMRGGPSRSFLEQSLDSSKKSTVVKKTKSRQWKLEKPKPKADVSSINTEHNLNLLKIIMNSASTNEEQYRILDARDKLIRSRLVRQSELSRARKTIGTCPDMCPEKERIMREVQHQVASYEQRSGHKGSMNHKLAVKQYSRSSADQEAPLSHELRPVKVLRLTMGYLLHKIMDLCETDVNLAEWYHFVWDRTRGIRKDITQQELCCLDSVELVEQCARFHVFCAARLISEDVSVFDDKINTENLTKCLQTLKYMYHDLRVKGVFCPNEAEFRAYIVLLNLNDGNFMWEVQQLDIKIQQSPEIKFAIQVYSALDKNNYVRFFKLVKSTTYLNACILLRYFNQVRYRAILTILKSYSPRLPSVLFPIIEFSQILAFEDVQSTTEFLEYYGLNINPEKTHIILDRRTFRQPDLPYSLDRAINVVESKRVCSVGEVVCGAPLPPKDFEKHIPHNSFDDNGFLKISELPKEFHDKYEEFLNKYSVNTGVIKDTNEEFSENNEEYEDNNELYEDNDEPMKMEESDQELSEKEDEIEEKPLPTFSFKDKFNENSNSEVDGTIGIFPMFKQKNLVESRSQSPLTINSNDNKEPTNKFWPKQSQNIFANTKTIFGNDLPAPVAKPDFKIISTTVVTTNIPSTSFVTPSFSKPEPFKSVTENFKPVFTATAPVKKMETIKNDNARKEQEDLIRKLKEKQEREERIRKEKKLQEIQERLNREQELAKINSKIRNDVAFVLHNVLNQVEEQLVRTRLNEISENIKKRRALQFLKRWRNLTRISRKKRKNFFDNPVWISSKSASAEAEELYTPSQSLTLHDIKRYKRGTSDTVKIMQQKSIEPIDVYKIVYRILFEKLCSGENVLNLNLFWKVGVSFKTENSIKLFARLKAIFDWTECNNEHLIVKRFYANNGGSLTYCIKELNDFNNFIFLNGLIFIISSEMTQNTYNRFIKLINTTIQIPVVILIKDSLNIDKNYVVQHLQLNSLIENEQIIDYNILYYFDNNLEQILTTSIKYLAQNVNSKPNLEMDALPVYLRNCIGEEFWFKIFSSCKINQRLDILLRDPNITIILHNESLQKSLDIIFDSELLEQPKFPNEFKPYVKQEQILLPCSFEYFPDYWNSKQYLSKVKKSVESLFLPKFDYVWPPKDQCDLQVILEDYCSKIFKDATCIVLKLLSLLLDKLNLNENFMEQIRLTNWGSVVQTIILEKLSTCQFYDKTHAVYTVAYKSDDFKRFRESPWWYQIDVIKNKIRLVSIETKSQQLRDVTVSEESEDEMIDLDKTIAELRQEEDDKYEEKQNLIQEYKHLTCLLADLENSINIQQKIMNKFQEQVTGALNCK